MQIRKLKGYQSKEVIITDCSLRSEAYGSRLNLIVPRIATRQAFGGVATAMRFFTSCAPFFDRIQIVVTDERISDHEGQLWQGWTVGDNPTSKRNIVYLKSLKASPFLYEEADVFVCTYWTTAEFYLRSIASAPSHRGKRWIYFIQDFEPSFYPWSSSYSMAIATYQAGDRCIAVFNTQLLSDYFKESGFRFSSQHVFEPALNPKLRKFLDRKEPHAVKEKLLIVYGRPTVARNAFELALSAIDLWSREYDQSADWKIVSIGEKHHDIRMSNKRTLRSAGKLTIDEYAHLLSRASVGLSLMISPHPSYPPLEMADFGVQVITNNFGPKNLSTRSPSIIGLDNPTSAKLAYELRAACSRYSPRNDYPPQQSSFLGGETEFPFLAELCAAASS